ncbi:hypothetical protein EOPP23_04095 [Endozoicomonas sp. OPT23]|uniref:DUF1631 family protein n=1 Tax=Endozoicomonas sp. OPT23 TaxID=2072845 RepID=UPI00129AC0C6|nr:DUF1631 family protein [Endozoicomonas sp. OPT23]MRI32177.1 hypothetical protein [Endozoicomonas sp. OPT23]
MTGKASNVIPLSRETNLPILGKINTQLINLFQDHFSSHVPDIITAIVAYCARSSEEGQNNVQIMRYLELRNQLLKFKEKIEAEFNTLSEDSFSIIDNPETKPSDDLFSSLSLIENSELEHDLAWQAASTQLGKDENYKYLLNSEKRLGSVTAIKPEEIPFSALKICENFSKALEVIEIDLEISQEVLLEFSRVIKERVYTLWQETDKHLESIGLELPANESGNHSPTTTQTQNPLEPLASQQTTGGSGHSGQTNELQGTAGHSVISTNNIQTEGHSFTAIPNQLASDSSENQLLEALAQKVVSKVEGLLATPTNNGTASSGEITFVASIDLATTLTAIQGELSGQQACLYSLTDSIKSALEERGVIKKLSARHNDLINFVGMLFEFILDDHELPDDVKKLIALLQIPVLKLTLLDESFLTDRHHSARELLNEMASAGMHTTLEPEYTDAVIQLIEQTVRRIIRDFSQSPDIFPVCLESFHSSLEDIYNKDDQNSDDLEPEDGPFIINQKALSNITSRYQVPDTIDSLVKDAWLEVLNHASDTEDDKEFAWEDAINSLEILLWNLQPDNAQHVSQEDWLHLKNIILEHLDQVEFSPFLTVEYMQSINILMQSNHPENQIPIEETDEYSLKEPFEEIVLEVDHSKEDEIGVLEQGDDSEPSSDVIAETASSSQEEKNRSAFIGSLNLSIGQWVEFVGQEGKQFKCKLASIDEKQNRFVFVNSAGMKVAEKHAYELGSDIENGRIRVVDNQAFFDKAINKVMHRFLKF